MKTWKRTRILALAVLIASCGTPEEKAERLVEIAAFEERQSNWEHATEVYEVVVEDYPDTEAAAEARRRIEAIRELEASGP